MGSQEPDIAINIVPRAEAKEFVSHLHATRPSPAVALVLGGDRWACCTHAALAKVAGNPVGIATLAPRGEQNTGEPTVVGLYVVREYRRHGVGAKLLAAAVRCLQERVPDQPVRLDILHSAVRVMVERLPLALKQNLDVRDQTLGGAMDALLEA